MTRSKFSGRLPRAGRSAGLALGATLVILAGAPGIVHGYRAATCNGKIWRGLHNNIQLEINQCHTPSSNTAERNVITYGVFMWQRLTGIIDRISTIEGAVFCPMSDEDQEPEIALVPKGHEMLDDLPGSTHILSKPCSRPFGEEGDGRLTVADVVVDQTLPLGSLSELDTRLGARETMVHELGHVLGADHENALPSVMCTGTTCGKTGTRNVTGTSGGRGETYFPDDVNFAATFHSTSGGKSDPAVSAWLYDTNKKHMALINTSPLRKTLCPGQTISLRYSYGNFGKTNIPETTPIRMQIVFSPNTIIENTDEPAVSFSFWGARGFFTTKSRTITVPDLDEGKYYVGLLTDPTNAKAEQDEHNNSTRLNVEITVPDGC